MLKNLTANSSLSITVSSQPLPLTATQRLRQQRVSAILIAFFFNQGMIFVPSTYIVFIVQEKQSKAKHQQLISGVSIPAYCLKFLIYFLFQ